MISVVVPTCRRPAQLARCLAALDRQDVEIEIVVVDDAGGAVAQGATMVRGAGEGPAAARNAGVQAARGEVICLVDDDCVPVPGWARSLAATCADGGAAAGPTHADRAAGRAAAAAQLITDALVDASRTGTALLGFAPSCNLACHADLLRAVPFDASFPHAAGEDRDWCRRLKARGVGLRFVPEAVVLHRPELGLRGLLRQQHRYGRGAVRFRRTGGRLAGPGFYRVLMRRAGAAGPAVGALVLAAQAAVAAGAAREALSGQ